jgi:hypothetical protein
MDRCRLAGEDQKGSLKGVLGVVVVTQDAFADAHDHRAVPPHERLECRLVASVDENFQQFAI